MAAPDFTPLANVAIGGFAKMLLWLIPLLIVVEVIKGLFKKIERNAKRKERIEEQLKYEEELMRERKQRGAEPELGEMPGWMQQRTFKRFEEPELEPKLEESWHERVQKHTREDAECCPTCGKRR